MLNSNLTYSCIDSKIESMPFIIGVTGHRDLQEISVGEVEKIAKEFFNLLKRDLPNVRIIVASGLAEGTDQLIAKVAISVGMELWAVLPTSVVEYEKDFISVESLKEFRKLLSSATEVLNASFLIQTDQDLPDRPKIYENLKDIICQISHILLAVWDGKLLGPSGGTSDVVNAFLRGQFSGASDDLVALPSCGDILHIHVPRSDSGVFSAKPNWLSANPLSQNENHSKRSHIAFAKHLKNKLLFSEMFYSMEFKDKETYKFLSNLLPSGFPWEKDLLILSLTQLFIRAEELSSKYVNRRQISLMFVVISFLLFSLLTLSYGGLIDHMSPLLLGFFLAIAAYVVSISSKQKLVESSLILNRGLAEILRVAIIWKACGVRQKLSPILATSGISHDDPLSFMAKSIDAIFLLRKEYTLNINSKIILNYWVTSQIDYFSGNTNKISYHNIRSKTYNLLAIIFIGIATLLYVATFIADITNFFGDRQSLAIYSVWSMFFYWTCLSISALFISFSKVMGHNELVESYRIALTKFQITSFKLNATSDPLLLSASLGRACLQEVCGWVLLKRRLPIRVPL